jgi:hypothetical protein
MHWTELLIVIEWSKCVTEGYWGGDGCRLKVVLYRPRTLNFSMNAYYKSKEGVYSFNNMNSYFLMTPIYQPLNAATTVLHWRFWLNLFIIQRGLWWYPYFLEDKTEGNRKLVENYWNEVIEWSLLFKFWVMW